MLIDLSDATLLVVDIQDKLLPAIRGAGALLANAGKLISASADAGLPIVFSEQYPRGLGHTAPSLLARAPRADIVEKNHFSCVAAGCLPDSLMARSQVIVCGMEAHVCVLQTVLELRAQGKQVFLVRDCIGSRADSDVDVALLRCQQAGVILVTREMVLFETLRLAGTDLFRHMSKTYLVEDKPLGVSQRESAVMLGQLRGKTFAEILPLLDAGRGHFAAACRLTLLGFESEVPPVLLEDKPGQSGSLRVYRYLLDHFQARIGPEAAEAGLLLYAEHSADARANPGKHPNIDRLLDIASGKSPSLIAVAG